MKKGSPWLGLGLGFVLLGCSAQPSPATDQAATALGTPSAEGLDCRSFTPYTAALATFTVDCTGSIGPESFRINTQGRLERAFQRCEGDRDQSQLVDIDQLLSLQRREARLPDVRACIAGGFADAMSSLESQGSAGCPKWTKIKTVNPIDHEVVRSLATQLQQLQDAPSEAAPALAKNGIPEAMEIKNLYRVSFADARDTADVSRAATACAAGFAGFVIETNGDTVLTDPPTWQQTMTFNDAAQDPFLDPSFYHAMSWYGGVPGVRYGHYNRFAPCPGCPPERCSYYTGVHKITRLQKDCIIDTDLDTCNSYCGPPQ
jgi:hypothetical protein